MTFTLRRAFVLGALATLVLAPPVSADDRVAGRSYVRHDSGTDAAVQHCNDASTGDVQASARPDDADSDDGGARRQRNEPFSVVDPTDPWLVVAGWNEYCTTDLGGPWIGIGVSRDGGATWTNSLLPGYPADTSRDGRRSPLFLHMETFDPVGAFDLDGNLFVGGIAVSRERPLYRNVFVSAYARRPQAGGLRLQPVGSVIVSPGARALASQGLLFDKPMVEIDRTLGPTAGNVYVCWTRFTRGGKPTTVLFTRSTDRGRTFARPTAISDDRSVQGCDIAVEADGDVYVVWRTADAPTGPASMTLAFARSADGGATFEPPRAIRALRPYLPFDGRRDCGDGIVLCPAGFVFARLPTDQRMTADQSFGGLPGVYVVFNAVATGEPSGASFRSAGPGQVGRSRVVVVRTLDDGRTWSDPVPVDPHERGHQILPDIDALRGRLAVVWQDSRRDTGYHLQRPIGNDAAATSSGHDVLATRLAWTATGTAFAPSIQVSSTAHQPQYELFVDESLPFNGDYNWLSLARRPDGVRFAYMTWTDNRDVRPGEDPRERAQDGFDVYQCRVERFLGSFSANLCPNAGGLDQTIYGASVPIP